MSIRLAAATAAVTLCALLAAPLALAGNVGARAGQNPAIIVSDTNGGASASANWGPLEGENLAQAYALRTLVQFSTQGQGTVNNQVFGSAFHRTDYQLWDLDGNVALTAEQSAGLVFDFRFVLQGNLQVEGRQNTLSAGQVDWSAAVLADSMFDAADSSAIIVFGPPQNEFLYSGDPSLHGAFNQSFSLQHQGGLTGVLTMSVAGSAGNLALSNARLELVGLTMAREQLPFSSSKLNDTSSSLLADPGRIGIRLQTGELLAISAVPEPQTWILMLSGAVWLACARRRAPRLV